MAGPLPVKGTEISSAPCSVQRAAGLLRRFLSSEAGAEVGIAKGYIEAVAQSLEEMLARRRESSGNGMEGLSVATAGRSSKFFNLEQVEKVKEVKKKKKKPRKEKEAKKDANDSKQKKKDQAMVDFEALLGHELDGAEANGFEEKSAVTVTTPRRADSMDESQKQKKKKRKSLVAGAMDMDVDGIKEEAVNDPDATKNAKKKKKRKSVDGAVSNGLAGDTPVNAIKVEESADEGMKPVEEKKKKMKKHGGTPLNSSVGDKLRNGNGSEVQQGSAKKKSKKRATEESPVVKAFNF